jgi:uncharacterized membrane protein
MRRASTTRTTIAGFLLIIGAAPAVTAADSVEAVTTQGSGTLTICRSWLVYDSCTTYSKVALPERIAVGDKLSLSYGSNPKDYTFPVLSIQHQGASCTILSDASAAAVGGEKIEVAQCQVAVN